VSLPVHAPTSLQSLVSIARENFAICFAIIVLVLAALVLYALRTKGDVRAVISYGKTFLELEAKERNRWRK
jgi:hypothetical protein